MAQAGFAILKEVNASGSAEISGRFELATEEFLNLQCRPAGYDFVAGIKGHLILVFTWGRAAMANIRTSSGPYGY